MRRAALAGATALALLGAAPAAAVPAALAPRVTAYEIRGEPGFAPPAGLGRAIALEVGAPLDPERVRESVERLRAAVGAAEVEARLRPVADGVEVVFALWTRVRVSEVRLAGDPCLKTRDLRELIEQRRGAALSESRLLRGLYRLQDRHREVGYLRARIRLDVEVDHQERAVVSYHFECGEQATIGGVVFEGDRGPFTSAELTGKLLLGPGSGFWENAVRDNAEALEERLISEGFRMARVEDPEIDYDPEANRVELLYRLEVGPRFEVRVSGADPGALERAGVMPLDGLERFDQALLLRDLARLERHYQERGHYRVKVDSRSEEFEGLRRLWILIEPGPVYELESVVWDPMTALTPSQLEAVIGTTARRRFGGRGRLVDEELEQDLSAVSSVLALRGFDRARVGPAVVEEHGRKLTVRVPVEEGPQRRVVHIELEGLEALGETEARERLRLREGGPFHPLLLEESLNGLRARYQELGYRRAQAEAALDWNEDRTLVDVRVRVLEGPRTVVGQVILRGNAGSDPQPILKAANLRSGDKVSRGDLLEAQRRIYALGIFSSVEVELAPGQPLSGRRDVVVRVREGRTRRFSYGVGWDSEDGLRTTLGYSHGNLFRRAVTGRLDLRWSERERQARVLFFQPFLGGLELPSTYSLFAVEEAFDSFLSKRNGFQFESSRLWPRSRVNLLYTYKVVEVELDEALAGLDPDQIRRVLDIERDLREVELSSVRPAWLLDRRDDPVRPSRGWSSTLSTEYAFPFLGTDAEFLKGFSQQTAYLDLGRFGVAAGSLRLGAIEPLGGGGGDVRPETGLPSLEVPISERFFAGGRTTHRAYRRDRLGVPGESLIDSGDGLVSVGGNGLLLVNLDWRFPIAGPVGGVAFVDAGNVWADWRNIAPEEAKLGAGLGVRYNSPIGPLRLEVGWKLDREPGESPAVLFLSFGNPF